MIALTITAIVFSSLLFLANFADMINDAGERPNQAVHMMFLAVIIVALSLCLSNA